MELRAGEQSPAAMASAVRYLTCPWQYSPLAYRYSAHCFKRLQTHRR
jgi:hypothetical protein